MSSEPLWNHGYSLWLWFLEKMRELMNLTSAPFSLCVEKQPEFELCLKKKKERLLGRQEGREESGIVAYTGVRIGLTWYLL